MSNFGVSILGGSTEKFSRRVIFPLATTVLIAIALVLTFVFISAGRQNQIALQSSTTLAQTALTVKKREIARNLKDYAVWEDAYKNLHVNLDLEWASTDGNVGANIFSGLGYERAFVINPAGQVVYSLFEGQPVLDNAVTDLPQGLEYLLLAAKGDREPAVGFLKLKGEFLLVAATSIVPPSVDLVTLPADKRSILVFAKTLNSKFLARIGDEYLLKTLRIVPSYEATLGASFPLLSPRGSGLGEITWTPDKPGHELLRYLLPPLVVSLVVLAIFSIIVIRNAQRSARAIETSARTIEAYGLTLQQSEARFRDVAEASSDWIWECDPEMQMTFFSARFTEVTGIAAASVLGKTLEQFFTTAEDDEGWEKVRSDSGVPTSFRDLRCRYRDAKDQLRICRLAGRPIVDPTGACVGYRGTATDITQEVEAHDRANHLALHDALTGLPNRTLFRERLDVALPTAATGETKVAVLCLDLDHFKEVNDTLGHAAGDILLRELSNRLRSCVLPSDTVARLGGDEFAVVQIGVNQPVEALALSRRIIEAVRQPFLIEGQELYVGVSIGVCIATGSDDSTEAMLKNADIALYRSKQSGRGSVRIFEANMDLELQARKLLDYDLRQALVKDELEVFYQPLIGLEGKNITGIEALVRWRHPVRGLVSPDAFIPLAEENGLIISIGEWVLRTACRQATQWPDMRVAVNLSPVQFKHRELVETVSQVLAETGLLPHLLELEITESVLLYDTKAALEVLTALKKLGVQIAMDDFGTGYSSLGYLNSFPFDKIKIDKSFITDINGNDKSNAIVKSVISLGQSLQMITTAEGVETFEQASFLRDEGCQQVQGYFFGRPMPKEELTALLQSWSGNLVPDETVMALHA